MCVNKRRKYLKWQRYVLKFDRPYFKYCHGINKNLTIYLERKTNENYEGQTLYTLQEDLIP